ncbi:MAG: SUF system NifU family Fe-S cluster assembly protein [Verrucomicrobiae bacterium]|nr:SUF system NifU family Fe-S cluster assembly protein [Verrucomicrobiae bacterium]MCP5539225.1 SUF system NifU family Fe-S cluster assembly protein [Akkermansiaceae bacterium]MCP5549878.1 SUF system NifU family Fe-S cluster assembly protein [Akkermansiaceae bacterium]
MDDELDDLYQEIILSHNKRPRNMGPLEPHSHEAEGYNPLCGDRYRIYVREGDDGKIEAVTFDGEGCAISKASASILTEAVKNHTRAEVDAKIAEALELLTAKEEPKVDLMTLGELAALAGVRKFPPRVKCATLAWHTLASALKDAGTISTEG